MIDISVCYDKNGYLKKMIIEGHAGIKNQDGYEVCIALSAISQAMVNALKNSLNSRITKAIKKSGYLKFSCKTDNFRPYDCYIYAIISKSFLDSIKDLAKQYKNFVNYKEYSNT